MVNYRQIRPFVPNWIRELVTKDNIAFIVDRQIYSDHFFELIRHIMQHISNDLMRVELENRNDTEQKPYYYKMKQLALQIGQRISFDFLTHFKDERSSMGVITRSMSTIQNRVKTQSSVFANFSSGFNTHRNQQSVSILDTHNSYFASKNLKGPPQVSLQSMQTDSKHKRRK